MGLILLPRSTILLEATKRVLPASAGFIPIPFHFNYQACLSRIKAISLPGCIFSDFSLWLSNIKRVSIARVFSKLSTMDVDMILATMGGVHLKVMAITMGLGSSGSRATCHPYWWRFWSSWHSDLGSSSTTCSEI